jgi:hypothetical protein
MTVAELIAELQKVDGDTTVQFQIDDGCCGDSEDLGTPSVDASIFKTEGRKEIHLMQIRFPAMRGLESCIKAGQTKLFIEKLYKSTDEK